MQRTLIIGATSAIAEATERLFAQRGDRLYLLARNEERLTALAQDLRIRGAEWVAFAPFDVNNFANHLVMLDSAIAALGGIDLVLIAHGTLPDQKACEGSIERTLYELNTNAISTLAMLTHLANRFEAQRQGVIAVISSVAGERGRQSNYIYGTAKGAVTLFLQGLRNRLDKSGIRVLTIKPGFVDTPMTADFKKNILWTQPEAIARGILRSIERKRDIAYLPAFWCYLMLIIRSIPESLFKKLNL
ncbi:decaprenylphospho-beta-D-erythro-pentofuranosid-2-ulose 2-reductase [Gammaproteobacteria bacterium]